MSAVAEFRHEALLYAGEEGFVAGALPFVRDALTADEPILVAVDRAKIARLRSELGVDADRVQFADMAELGTNPARILPAWRSFVDAAPAGRARGIGEPIWAGRSSDEVVECHRHEALLNAAFADDVRFWLLCPYDTAALDPAIVADAHCTHPFLVEDGVQRASAGFDVELAPFAVALPEPEVPTLTLDFDLGSLREVRALVSGQAAAADLSRSRSDDLLLAVNEVATNSVRHGGGSGTLRVWRTDDALVCEVRDGGRIEDPFVGRREPKVDQVGGYGMWMVNQVCELVQVRSSAQGSVVRMFMRR